MQLARDRDMAESAARIIAVTGATGLQGTAVTRRLLREGWRVRALTRDPRRKRARLLSLQGADVVQADMGDRQSLTRAFDDVHGVYSVQNHHISGYDGEVAQGKNVTDAALRCDVPHVVYGAAGVGRAETGVGSWDTKAEIIGYMRERQLPLTILRPMAFMELMTTRKFFPQASTWHIMPELMGPTRPVAWLAVDDLAAIAAKAFGDPKAFLGRDLPLAADVQSIEECRQLWREAMGRPPRSLPMPLRLFERFVGTDETTMWRWLRSHEIDLDTRPTLDIHPHALSVRSWLSLQTAAAAGAATG